MKHPIGIIICSHAPPTGISFTIENTHFSGFATYDDLPERLLGEIDSWTSKKDDKVKVLWHADETNSIEYLSVKLSYSSKIKIEPLKDGRSAPKPKGSTAQQRMYALAMQGMAAEDGAVEAQKLAVAYTEDA